jgi:hypothetical protein
MERSRLTEELGRFLTRSYEIVLAAGKGASRAADARDGDLRDRLMRSVDAALADARAINEEILRLGGQPSAGLVNLIAGEDAHTVLDEVRALESAWADQAEFQARAAHAWGDARLARALGDLACAARERAADAGAETTRHAA